MKATGGRFRISCSQTSLWVTLLPCPHGIMGHQTARSAPSWKPRVTRFPFLGYPCHQSCADYPRLLRPGQVSPSWLRQEEACDWTYVLPAVLDAHQVLCQGPLELLPGGPTWLFHGEGFRQRKNSLPQVSQQPHTGPSRSTVHFPPTAPAFQSAVCTPDLHLVLF